jgi:hypothetical protein
MVSDAVLIAGATLLGLAALVIGAAELAGRRPRLLQRDMETPQRWLYGSGLRWALLNGSALGIAITTRLGFSLWYVIPAGSFLTADPALGACIYGTYGFTRTASVYLLLRWKASVIDSAEVTDILRSWQPRVRRTCAAALAGIGVAAIVVVGP